MHGLGLVPNGSRRALEHIGNVLAVRVVADKHDRRGFGRMILSIVVGLNARADGLQDEGVMFSQNGDVPFRSEDGFFLIRSGSCG